MRNRLRILAILFFSGCSHSAFDFQNDVFTGKDGNFTNGAELKYSAPSKQFPEFAKSVFGLIPVPEMDDTNIDSQYVKPIRYSIGLRQDIYTPDNLLAKNIVEDQNPYAGTLTLDLKRTIMTPSTKVSTQIRFGSSGDYSFAEQTQIGVHDGLTRLGRPQKHPSGWDNQIATEPLANIDHERSWEDLRLVNGPLGFALQGTELARLGNIQTDATFSYGARAGYNLPTLDSVLKDKFSLFTFSDPYISARARNLYYDGGIFTESPHTVGKEIFIGGLESGFGVQYNSYELRFIYNLRTRDYKEQVDFIRGFGFLSFGVGW